MDYPLEGKTRCRQSDREIGIRPLLPGDGAALHEIASQTFPKPWKVSDFAYFIGHPAALAFGVLNDSVLVGYFLGLLSGDDLDVLSLAVKREWHRQGFARVLLEEALSKAAHVFLEVAVTNVAAMTLYQRAGFRISGMRPRYYEGKEDAMLMRFDRT